MKVNDKVKVINNKYFTTSGNIGNIFSIEDDIVWVDFGNHYLFCYSIKELKLIPDPVRMLKEILFPVV